MGALRVPWRTNQGSLSGWVLLKSKDYHSSSCLRLPCVSALLREKIFGGRRLFSLLDTTQRDLDLWSSGNDNPPGWGELLGSKLLRGFVCRFSKERYAFPRSRQAKEILI